MPLQDVSSLLWCPHLEVDDKLFFKTRHMKVLFWQRMLTHFVYNFLLNISIIFVIQMDILMTSLAKPYIYAI